MTHPGSRVNNETQTEDANSTPSQCIGVLSRAFVLTAGYVGIYGFLSSSLPLRPAGK